MRNVGFHGNTAIWQVLTHLGVLPFVLLGPGCLYGSLELSQEEAWGIAGSPVKDVGQGKIGDLAVVAVHLIPHQLKVLVHASYRAYNSPMRQLHPLHFMRSFLPFCCSRPAVILV